MVKGGLEQMEDCALQRGRDLGPWMKPSLKLKNLPPKYFLRLKIQPQTPVNLVKVENIRKNARIGVFRKVIVGLRIFRRVKNSDFPLCAVTNSVCLGTT